MANRLKAYGLRKLRKAEGTAERRRAFGAVIWVARVRVCPCAPSRLVDGRRLLAVSR